MSDSSPKLDFIREIIADDLATGKHATTITRFPPEPNGYLHIGHAKSICLNFGIAQENGGSGAKCHLRFDDTNPEKEETEYVESIKADVKWLGFDWGDDLYFASNYFGFFHDCAVHLIREGKAKSRVLRLADLENRRFFVGNSLRGLIAAELVGQTARSAVPAPSPRPSARPAKMAIAGG